MSGALKQVIIARTYVLSALFFILIGLHTSAAAAIAHGYTTQDTGLQIGMVVSLSTDGSNDRVERATQEKDSHVIGVATTADNSLITVGSGTAQVLVETQGQVDVYISDINGGVNKGDLLVLSPLKGILMKAEEGSQAKIIGIAAATPGETTSYDYMDGSQTKQTNIAKIPVDLNYLGADSGNGAQSQDSTLERLGRKIAGKDIGEIRVLIALVIFVIVLVAEGGILYGAISSAVTALGRNPLARTIIRSELLRVILVALGVLLVGLAAVYAILHA